jgi:hypothetical protein
LSTSSATPRLEATGRPLGALGRGIPAAILRRYDQHDAVRRTGSIAALANDCVCVPLGWPSCGQDCWLGCLVGKRKRFQNCPRQGLRAKGSSMNGRRPRTQLGRLVVHADCDATDLMFVLTRVMGAEQQLAAAHELDS